MVSATIFKKKMFYNMRIRTIKRNANFLIKNIDALSHKSKESLIKDTKDLALRSKKLDKWLYDASPSDPNIHQYEEAKSIVEELLKRKESVLEQQSQQRTEIVEEIHKQADLAIRKLLLELETGGNVRFEDEGKDDSWVRDCELLIKEFIKRSASKDSPKSIQIHRLSRLHNRTLKLHVQEKASARPDITPSSYCVQDDLTDEQIFEIVEKGVGALNHPVVFSNYLDCVPTQIAERRSLVKGYQLKKALIVTTYIDKSKEIATGNYLVLVATLKDTELNPI